MKRLILLFSLVLMSACAANRPATKITACYSQLSGTQSAIWYAKEKGYFQRHGLDVDLILASGGPAAVATLVSGQTQFCQATGVNALSASQAGEEIVIIAGIVNKSPYKLVVRKEITHPSQLAGQTFGVRDLRGASEFALRQLLVALDVPLDKIKFVSLPTPQATLAALESGAIVGSVFVPPETLQATQRGFVEIPVPAGKSLDYQHTAIVARRAYVQQNRSSSLAFVRAMSEAIAEMKRDEAGYTAVLAQYLKLDPGENRELLQATYREIVLGRFESIPRPSVEGVSFLIAQSPAPANARTVTASDVVDTSLVLELERSGVLAGPGK